MNRPTLFLCAATAALAVSLAGCAEAQPRYGSYTPHYTSPPQSYGTASVRYVQPAGAPPAPEPVSHAHRQPNMRRALADLENARAQLNAATANKGGHRQNALQAVDEAIGHVQSGIDYDNSH